jgi:ABC-2 type transport system permease protein
MNKTFLIFRHEFMRTLKRKGFIFLTLSLPVLALIGIGVFRIISGMSAPSTQITKVGYVDEVGGFDQFTRQGNIELVSFQTTEDATQALLDKDVKSYFVIPSDFVSTGMIRMYDTQKQLEPPTATIGAIKTFTSSNLLTGKVSQDVIARVDAPLNVSSTLLTSTGEISPEQAGYANFIVPAVFSFLLMFSLIFSSAYVIQSLGEEKENRLMEILLSSVSTRELLVGKVLGLGTAGLVQVLVWVVSLPLLINLASSSIGGLLSSIQVPFSFWVLGIVYFILGYSIFAVLSAGIAAVTGSLQEAQGLSGLYTLFNVVPFWFISLLMIFPNSPVWVALSIFPFTAPVSTMLRMGITGVPLWQIAASIAVLLLSITGGLMLDARLLRTYLLMYGKRPNLGAIVRSLRTA